VLEGKNQYNAAVVEWSKRATHGFGGRVSYTYSVLKDNQVGEGNFYSAGGTNPLNNWNYIPTAPACSGNNGLACYNPDADYTYSLLDVPHRLIIAPSYELPFGKGQKYGANSKVADWVLGGWQATAAINIQSGFPIQVGQSDNNGVGSSGVQRPNLINAGALATSGSYEDRLASADHPTSRWVSLDAFALAPAFTYGNAPRDITDVRTARQANVDASFGKNFRFGTKAALLKIEMLNLTNRVQTRALNGRNTYAPGSSTFGQTAIQAGFMRITQIMLRFTF